MKRENSKSDLILKKDSKREAVCAYHNTSLGYKISIPVGCRACGNPAYPKCKASCPLFDD